MSKLDTKPITDKDAWLEPFLPAISSRYDLFSKWKSDIQASEGGYDAFSKGYSKFGLTVAGDGTITYREWAPNAQTAHLIGDFSTQFFSRASSVAALTRAHRRMGPQHPPAQEERLRRMGDLHPPSQRPARHSPRFQDQGAFVLTSNRDATRSTFPLSRSR